jgi:hypothetical protein
VIDSEDLVRYECGSARTEDRIGLDKSLERLGEKQNGPNRTISVHG